MNTDRYLITRNIGESFQEYCDVNNTNVESERIDDVEGVEEKDAIAPMRRKNSGRKPHDRNSSAWIIVLFYMLNL